MTYSRPVKQFAGAFMGLALCVSSTAAGAAATPTSSASPLVALSAFGTPASASAVRPALHIPNAANLQMSAAAVQGDPYDDRGFSWLPALLGVALLIGVVILILNDDDDGHIDLRPTPVSPS